jgi:hypothetical protein
MAKLFTAVTAHGKSRTSKNSDDIRIIVDAHHKNIFLGSFEMYHVHDNDTVNVLWRPHNQGAGSEIMLITESKPA